MTVPLALLAVLVCVCCVAGGILLLSGLTGASLRCGIRGHRPGSELWSSPSGNVGYCCPRCGTLWLPDPPSLEPKTRRRRVA